MFLRNPEPERPKGRHPDDFYATPRWCTEAMLYSSAPLRDAALIVEPSCGDGAILDVVGPWSRPVRGRWAGHRKGPRVVGFDVDGGRVQEARRRGHDVGAADFLLSADIGDDLAWVVGNPPFSLAREFVDHSLSLVSPGSRVTFLLRLAFLASQDRAHLYAKGAGFRHLGVLGRRPSFTPGGGTDSSDYGWFTWEKGWRGPATVERL